MSTKTELFINNPSRQVVYEDWLKHPGTIMVRELVDELAVLTPLGQTPNGDMALYRYGFAEGAQTAKDFMFDLIHKLTALRKLSDASQVEADYGAPRPPRTNEGVTNE